MSIFALSRLALSFGMRRRRCRRTVRRAGAISIIYESAAMPLGSRLSALF